MLTQDGRFYVPILDLQLCHCDWNLAHDMWSFFHSVHLALVLHLRLRGQEKTNSTVNSACLFVC